MKIVLSFIIWYCSLPVFSQNAVVLLKFEDAEKAFNSGNYAEVLKHLEDVEQQAGITSKTLYLRIVAENKLFSNGENLYHDEQQFTYLQHLRTNTAAYLKTMSKQDLDDRYREVYHVAENLKQFPKNKPEWLSIKHALEGSSIQERNTEIFTAVEVPPAYPGGTKAFYGFLSNNLQYPQAALEKNIKGKVTIGFIVEKDGTLSDFKVLEGVSKELDEEAIRVLKLSPGWTPGIQKDEAVRVSYKIPLTFNF